MDDAASKATSSSDSLQLMLDLIIGDCSLLSRQQVVNVDVCSGISHIPLEFGCKIDCGTVKVVKICSLMDAALGQTEGFVTSRMSIIYSNRSVLTGHSSGSVWLLVGHQETSRNYPLPILSRGCHSHTNWSLHLRADSWRASRSSQHCGSV